MKTVDIVRRVDDLGRVVIPKELRKALQIREGDPLELSITPDGILLKKYQPIKTILDEAKEIADAIHETIGVLTLIMDNDNVIAVSGGRKAEYLNKPYEEILTKLKYSYMKQIFVNGDSVGYIIIDCEKEPTKREISVVDMAATYLAKNLERQ